MHSRFVPYEGPAHLVGDFSACAADPNQMRWMPVPLPDSADGAARRVDFVDGLATVAGNGAAGGLQHGLATHVYACNAPMRDRAFSCADGELLVVPQQGALAVTTEMGLLLVAPGDIVVLPRGVRFSVAVDGPSRGYVLEVFGGHFRLPELGPIGANGLANARDFLYPTARYEDRECPGGEVEGESGFEVVNKFGGKLFSCRMCHSPFDVVAWHGTLAPYKYDLSRFNVIGTVSFDHPDPSIFTVLTCPSDTPGVALADFVIFPPRWMVAEKTFRPPYFHRNIASEMMGMIWGKYDAKAGGFVPGGISLHNCMTPHGPDAATVEKATAATLAPVKFEEGCAFMFETGLLLRATPWALEAPHRDKDYQKCWQSLPRFFAAPPKN